jgi:hypothetical protein
VHKAVEGKALGFQMGQSRSSRAVLMFAMVGRFKCPLCLLDKSRDGHPLHNTESMPALTH